MAESGFPIFAARVFTETPEIAALLSDLPSARLALFEIGLPQSLLGGRYSADSGLSVLPREGRSPVVCFGSSGLFDAIGIDTANGNVVDVIKTPDKPVILDNATAMLFTRTVHALIDRFPYHAKDAGYEEVDAVSEELRGIIRSIDPKAAVPGCYWPSFVDDVQMGDFNTEDILSWERHSNLLTGAPVRWRGSWLGPAGGRQPGSAGGDGSVRHDGWAWRNLSRLNFRVGSAGSLSRR